VIGGLLREGCEETARCDSAQVSTGDDGFGTHVQSRDSQEAARKPLDRAGLLPQSRCKVRSIRFILAYTVGVLRDSRARRTTMFYTTLGSVLLLFIGAVLIDHVLRDHPLCFIAWWGMCAWLMLASLLLAVFDILLIRAAARRARRELARKILAQQPDDHPS